MLVLDASPPYPAHQVVCFFPSIVSAAARSNPRLRTVCPSWTGRQIKVLDPFMASSLPPVPGVVSSCFFYEMKSFILPG